MTICREDVDESFIFKKFMKPTNRRRSTKKRSCGKGSKNIVMMLSQGKNLGLKVKIWVSANSPPLFKSQNLHENYVNWSVYLSAKEMFKCTGLSLGETFSFSPLTPLLSRWFWSFRFLQSPCVPCALSSRGFGGTVPCGLAERPSRGIGRGTLWSRGFRLWSRTTIYHLW